jgi:hypothetical protein
LWPKSIVNRWIRYQMSFRFSWARIAGDRLEGLTLATADFYEKQLALCEHYPQDLVAAYQYIQSHLDEARAGKLMAEVERSLDKRHRASSAIEGFNSLLRPYMYVRKGVSQGFLELFQAWHNLWTRRGGKHKGTSAYETLTGNKVDDWLTRLGFPRSGTVH